MGLWQLFLDRFAPLMEEQVSGWDRLDGVGAPSRPVDAPVQLTGAFSTRLSVVTPSAS